MQRFGTFWFFWVSLAVAFAPACDREEEVHDQPRASVSAAPQPSPAAPPTDPFSGQPVPAPAPGSPAQGSPIKQIQDPAKGLAALGQALGAAAQAEGRTNCEKSYNGLVAMVRALESQTGVPRPRPLPEQAQYLAVCNALPEKMQQCTVMAYAMQHQAECREARDNLSPELKARLAALRGN